MFNASSGLSRQFTAALGAVGKANRMHRQLQSGWAKCKKLCSLSSMSYDTCSRSARLTFSLYSQPQGIMNIMLVAFQFSVVPTPIFVNYGQCASIADWMFFFHFLAAKKQLTPSRLKLLLWNISCFWGHELLKAVRRALCVGLHGTFKENSFLHVSFVC